MLIIIPFQLYPIGLKNLTIYIIYYEARDFHIKHVYNQSIV